MYHFSIKANINTSFPEQEGTKRTSYLHSSNSHSIKMADTPMQRQTLTVKAAAVLASEICLHIKATVHPWQTGDDDDDKIEEREGEGGLASAALRVKLTAEYTSLTLAEIKECCIDLTGPPPPYADDDEAHEPRSYLELDVLAVRALTLADQLIDHVTVLRDRCEERMREMDVIAKIEKRARDVMGEVDGIALASQRLLGEGTGSIESRGSSESRGTGDSAQ